MHITGSRWHEQLWGFKPGEFDGTFQAFAARIHPSDFSSVNNQITDCIAAHKPVVNEFRLVWPDHSIHWISARAEFTYNADGEALRMRGAVTEISAIKGTEAALRHNERLLSESQRIAHIGSWALDLATNELS